MEKPRFSPIENNPKELMWKKEVYRREEKLLNLGSSPVKAKYQEYIDRFKPKQGGLPEELRRSEDRGTNKYSDYLRDSEKNFHHRVASDLSQSIQNVKKPWVSNDKNWEAIYQTKYEAANQLKQKYDYNNRSPITWLAKQDSISNSAASKRFLSSNSQIADISKVYSQLNSKKVFKGMGYAKSNIFLN